MSIPGTQHFSWITRSRQSDREAFKFSKNLLQIFALALGLEETALDETFQFPMTDITMQYYPVQDPNDQSSISPHADYGGLTVLYQGETALEVRLAQD